MKIEELESYKERANTYQLPVYEHVGTLIKKYNLTSVLDIGCGYPVKLKKYVLPLTTDITGIDLPDVIEHTVDFEFGKWIPCDLSSDVVLDRTFDIIVCSDVIEHLRNPANLLKLIRECSNENTILVISTPDTNTTTKVADGRPQNASHLKEWKTEELKAYLENQGFKVLNNLRYIEGPENHSYINNCFVCKKTDFIAKKKILVSLPNLHWIHKLVIHKALLLLQDRRYEVKLIMPSHKPYVNNLHHIVNDFISGGYDYWLNIDADNPPNQNPLDLVELDKDVIGLPTPIWHFEGKKKGERPVYWNAYKYDPSSDAYWEYQERNGLQEVDAVGTGCVLFARRVFEHPEMRKAPFMRKWNEDGTVDKGNDISFCERAKANGFKIYCHFDYSCDHMCELSMNETVRGFREMYEAG